MLQKKKKKVTKLLGSRTYGGGAAKKRRGAGNRGGRGKAGSGFRADQNKQRIFKKYGKDYFGKRGFKKKNQVIVETLNIDDINQMFEMVDKKEKVPVVQLREFKVLSKGELRVPVEKIICKAISAKAKEKLEKANCAVEIVA